MILLIIFFIFFIPVLIYAIVVKKRTENVLLQILQAIGINIIFEGDFKCNFESFGARTIGHDSNKCKIILTKKDFVIYFYSNSVVYNSISKPIYFSNQLDSIEHLKIKRILPLTFKKGIVKGSIFLEYEEETVLNKSTINVSIFDVPEDIYFQALIVFENVV
jgi:hypothetical protein